MYDYLNEFLLFAGSKNRKNASYKEALDIKRKGDLHTFDWMCRQWTNRYLWTCPEKSVATDLIEPALLYAGVVGISRFKYDTRVEGLEYNDLRLWQVSQTGKLGFYNRPSSVLLKSFNGKTTKKGIPYLEEMHSTELTDTVLIFDNVRQYMPITTILHYCKQLSMIQQRQYAAIANILPTSIITADHEQKMAIEKSRTLANLGVPYIIELNDNTGLPASDIKFIQAPGVREELQTLYELQDKIKSQYLTEIGIADNSKVNKMSGINPIEITEGRQGVNIILNAGLEMRRKACKQCKELFNIDLNVTLKNFENEVNESDEKGQREVDEDIAANQ